MAAPPRAVVVNAPWNWPGVSYTRGRRVADLADDWRILIPARRTHLENLYRRIENEADEIVVASVELKSLFHREVVVVPNAVAPELLARPLTIPPRERRMVYLGTLSERFDARLMTDVLRILPDWKLDLYGPCQYRGHGGEPNHELAELLTTFRHQVRWHGPLSRVAISDRLDAADVLVIPNNVGLTKGQDSMKLYDYAARGRPIVATILSAAGSGPPGAAAHESAEEFADAVRAGLDDPAPLPHARREWAETNTWDRRVGPWLAAVLGPAA